MPAWAVTSVNSIGPEGRTGLGLGDGEAAATSSLGWAAVGAFEEVSLQAETRHTRQTRRQYVSIIFLTRKKCGFPLPRGEMFIEMSIDNSPGAVRRSGTQLDLYCSSNAPLLRTSSEFFFFNDTATTEIYTLSLHDALPI